MEKGREKREMRERGGGRNLNTKQIQERAPKRKRKCLPSSLVHPTHRPPLPSVLLIHLPTLPSHHPLPSPSRLSPLPPLSLYAGSHSKTGLHTSVKVKVIGWRRPLSRPRFRDRLDMLHLPNNRLGIIYTIQ